MLILSSISHLSGFNIVFDTDINFEISIMQGTGILLF